MIRTRVCLCAGLLLVTSVLPTLAQQSAPSVAKAIMPPGKAQAQTMTFKTHVPFPFVLGNQTLPTGTYQIQRLMGRPTDADQIGIIVVRSVDFPIVPAYKAVVTNLVHQSLSSGSSSQLGAFQK